MRAKDPKRRAAPEDFISHSAVRSAVAIARNWVLMIALAALAEGVGWWWLAAFCVLGIGTVQFALGEALVHEASHYNLFRARAWNDRLEALYALPFLTTMRAYRAEHLQHHGRLGKDDDHVVRDYTHQRLTMMPARAAWAWFAKPALGITAFEYVRWLWKMNSAHDWLKVALCWAPVLIVCAIAGLLPELLLYWFLPLFAVFALFCTGRRSPIITGPAPAPARVPAESTTCFGTTTAIMPSTTAFRAFRATTSHALTMRSGATGSTAPPAGGRCGARSAGRPSRCRSLGWASGRASAGAGRPNPCATSHRKGEGMTGSRLAGPTARAGRSRRSIPPVSPPRPPCARA